MINKLWFFLIVIGIVFGFINDKDMSNVILNSAGNSYNMIINLGPLIILWSGIMCIAEKSGLLYKFSLLIRPVLKLLFPKVKGEKSLEYISSNVAANMLGLGSAATPFGLKAMQELSKENDNKDVASDSMITFLVMNTSGLTLIPVSVIGMRLSYGSINPTNVIIPTIIATSINTFIALLVDYLIRRKHIE
jgi:spore maturation protein A